MCDLLISPPMGSYTAASFSDYSKIIEIGNEEGRRMYPVFKHLADSLNAIQKVDYDPYKRLPEKSYVVLDGIEVKGLTGIRKKQLIEKMGLKVGGTYSASKLSDALKTTYSSLSYKYLYYELYPSTKPNHVLISLVTEESEGQWVKLGLFYNYFLGAAVTVNYTLRNTLFTNSRTFFKLSIGDNLNAYAQSRYYWGSKSNNQLQGELNFTDLKIPIYNGAQKLFVYNTLYLMTDFSYTRYIGDYTSIGGGLSYELKRFSPDIASSLRVNARSSNMYLHINQTFNNFDRRFFTTEGVSSSLELGYIFGRSSYLKSSVSDGTTGADRTLSDKSNEKVKYSFTGYLPVSKKTSLVGAANFGALLNREGVYFGDFFLGGEQSLFKQQAPFVGFRDAHQIVNSYVTALVGVQDNIFSNVYAQARINYGYYNFINSDVTISSAKKNQHALGFGLTAGYFLSRWPIQASVSYSPQIGKLFGTFSIGYAFY